MRAATLAIAAICTIVLGFVEPSAQEPVMPPVQAVDSDRAARDARSARVLSDAREAYRVALAAERIARATEYLKQVHERLQQYSPQAAASESVLDDRGPTMAETSEWPNKVDHRDGLRELNEGMAAQQRQQQPQWQQPQPPEQWRGAQRPAQWQQPHGMQQPQPQAMQQPHGMQ